jgi:DNA-binding beta-propeller fold protein YncE
VRTKWFTPVGAQPWGMAMSADGALLFVASSEDNTAVAYDTRSMESVAKVTVNRPMGLALREARRLVSQNRNVYCSLADPRSKSGA